MSTPLANVILRGVRSAQPAAADVCAGSLYFVTDELVLERSNGTTWDSYSGSTSGGFVLTDVQTVASATTSVTFTGLNGNTDIVYLLIGRIKNATGGGVRYDWLPNNLSTGQASFRGASSYATLVLGELAANGYVTFQATIAAQANPHSVAFPRTYEGSTSEVTTVPAATGGAIGGIWTDTSTNMTSIVVTASVASGIAEGSMIALLKFA